MIEFNWELQQVLHGLDKGLLERQSKWFLRPHNAIWGDTRDNFAVLAESIMERLPEDQQRMFLAVCLGSYLLAPEKAPDAALDWLQKQQPITKIIGSDLSLEELLSWRWDRAAFPVVDEFENGKHDTIYYALVAGVPAGKYQLFPSWIADALNTDAMDAVEIAAELAGKSSNSQFFFWPFINPKKPVHDRSLGLPLYLSFLSLARGKPIPSIIATGEIDRQGGLFSVQGVEHKCNKAFEKKYGLFIYPEDGSRLESQRERKAIGVATIAESEVEWGIDSRQRNLAALRPLLSPLAYDNDLKRRADDFIGREWLIEQINAWLADQEGNKIFWLGGDPGVGKSAIAAWLCSNRKDVAGWHFCTHYSEEHKSAGNVVRSLAYQLACHWPPYAEQILNDAGLKENIQNACDEYALFDRLMVRPLNDIQQQGMSPRNPLLIVVDALDEAATGTRNPLANLLARRALELPPWFRFLVTSRMTATTPSSFCGAKPHLLDKNDIQNRVDIATYVQSVLPGESSEIRQKVVERSQGIFLCAIQLIREIREGRLAAESLDSVPSGLNDYYRNQFERLFSLDLQRFRSEIRPLLCLVSAACEPLPLGLIRSVLGIANRMVLSDRLGVLSAFYRCSGMKDEDTLAPFHQSINEWISDWEQAGPYFADAKYGHELLAAFGMAALKLGAERLPGYLLAWLPSHLRSADNNAEKIEVLKNFDLMMSRAKAGLLERMLEDYRSCHEDELSVENDFFGENAHILRRGCEVWPAYKILLQLAVEHADNSPITQGAERFLESGKCDWLLIRQVNRGETFTCDQKSEPVSDALITTDNRIITWLNIKSHGIYGNDLNVYDNNGALLFALKGHKKSINGALTFSDGRILSWSNDKTLFIWSRDGQLLNTLVGHRKEVRGAFLLPNGNFLSWANEKCLLIWQDDGTPAASLEGHKSRVLGACLLPDNSILSWASDGNLRTWSLDGEQITVFEGHKDRVIGAIVLDKENILSWSDDKTLRIWSAHGETRAVLGRYRCPVRGVVRTTNGQIVFWSDYGIFLYDINGNYIKFFDKFFFNSRRSCGVLGVIELPNGKLLSGSTSPWAVSHGALQLWSADGELEVDFIGHTWPVNGFGIFSENTIASWSNDGTLRVWSNDGYLLATWINKRAIIWGAEKINNTKILAWSDSLYILEACYPV